MRTFFDINEIISFTACALTIGDFDGVHQGHWTLLKLLKQKANELNVPTVLITFEPLAKEFFAQHPNQSLPVRITPLEDKLKLIEQSGFIDYVIVLEFNHSLSLITAHHFVETIIINQLHTQYLLIGDDFKFGHNRQGNYEFLLQYPQFHTEKINSILIDGIRVSSSTIRKALFEGNFTLAEQLLGHTYSLTGLVKHGLKLGRQIDCKTANIDLKNHSFPLNGVYVVEVHGDFGYKKGVANFGLNPTTTHDQLPKLEVHIFDFNQDIYGKNLTITFKKKLRDEIKFDDLSSLQKQIKKDIINAQNWQDYSI